MLAALLTMTISVNAQEQLSRVNQPIAKDSLPFTESFFFKPSHSDNEQPLSLPDKDPVITPVYTSDENVDLVSERQELFKVVNNHFEQLLDGLTANPHSIHLTDFLGDAQMGYFMTNLLMRNYQHHQPGGNTTPDAWNNLADFTNRLNNMLDIFESLQDSIADGDLNSSKSHVYSLQRSCRSCHNTYKR